MSNSSPWKTFALRHWRPSLGALLLAGIAIVLMLSRFQRIPDFGEFEAGAERKSEFFTYLRPLMSEANSRILDDRQRLELLAADSHQGWLDRRWLESLAGDYGIEDGRKLNDKGLITRLLRHVDIVPMSLALAQAATESGWGTSRFVIEGNNLFGEWCYVPGCGLTPLRRDEGRSHEVRSFARPAQSVKSYIRNINTHEKYRNFRLLREQMRQKGRALSGLELAGELTQYSERRDAYVEEIREMIRFNNLEKNSG